jgi:hypothetical protein
LVDAIPRVPAAYPATAFVGEHEQGTFSILIDALADCLCNMVPVFAKSHAAGWTFPSALALVTIATSCKSASPVNGADPKIKKVKAWSNVVFFAGEDRYGDQQLRERSTHAAVA